MSNKTYDRLALFQRIIIPALIALYGTIGETLNLPYTSAILAIAAAVNFAFGTILKGISATYFKNEESESEDNAE